MVYQAFLNGKDMFGGRYYHAVIDECVMIKFPKLVNYLDQLGYYLLNVNKELAGIPDEEIMAIALLNHSSIITCDAHFQQRVGDFEIPLDRVIYFHPSKPKTKESIIEQLDGHIIDQLLSENEGFIVEFFNDACSYDLISLFKFNESNCRPSKLMKHFKVVNKTVNRVLTNRPFDSVADLSSFVRSPYRLVHQRAVCDLNERDDYNVVLNWLGFPSFKNNNK